MSKFWFIKTPKIGARSRSMCGEKRGAAATGTAAMCSFLEGAGRGGEGRGGEKRRGEKRREEESEHCALEFVDQFKDLYLSKQ